jgi:hypothetical protein
MFNFSVIPLPVKILTAVFVVIGAAGWGFMEGTARADKKFLQYQLDATKQISELRIENASISGKVVTEFVDRTNTVRERETIYRDAAGQLPPQHDLSNGWVHLHDAAARLVNPDMQMASDASPSGVMDNSALAVVMSNYAICKQNSIQLIALQTWITDNKAAIDEANLNPPEGNR